MVSIFCPSGKATWVVKLKYEDCLMSVISEHQETDNLAVSLAEVTRGFLSCSGDTPSLEGKRSYF